MKITKLVHACLLVEMPDRTALFDPGMMSEGAVNIDSLEFLDDIIITHEHGDHLSIPLIQKLVAKFPKVRVTGTLEIVQQLQEAGIQAGSEPSEGIAFFDSPHENVEPLFPVPTQIGVHYLDRLSHPGDGLHFKETKTILALPVQGPWQFGTPVDALQKALELKPAYVIPIHDWHWNDQAREQLYNGLEQVFQKHGITFLKMQTGQPVNVDV